MLSKPTTSEFLKFANFYVTKGWPVIPLHYAKDADLCSCGSPTCKSPGKHPKTGAGVKDGSTDPKKIEQWFKISHANVGICTGPSSGLIVIDIDPRHGGNESIKALQATLGPLPSTVEAITGGGGSHLFFKHPPCAIKNFTHFGSRILGQKMTGVDVKAENGYVVATPSIHKSGGLYEWEVSGDPEETELAVLPDRWIEALTANKAERQVASSKVASADLPDLNLITTNCAFLKHCIDDACTLPESEWYASLSIVGLCSDGRARAHEISKPYPGYTADETDLKLAHALEASGPRTCNQIQNDLTDGGYCSGCRFNQMITSPIELGRLTGKAFNPDRVQVLINEVQSSMDYKWVYTDDAVQLLANLSAVELAITKTTLKNILQDKLSLHDLAKIIKERRSLEVTAVESEQNAKAVTFNIAKDFIATEFTSEDDPTLIHHGGDFLVHEANRYDRRDSEWLRSEIYKKLASLLPDKRTVDYILDAIKGLSHERSLSLPFFRGNNGIDPTNIIAFRNGLLDITGECKLLPHTPKWVSENVLPYDYDPEATCPLWEAKLQEVFKDDPTAIDALCMWYGYNLTTDMSHHYCSHFLGVRRGFKGTAIGVMKALVGDHNVIAPTFASLAGPFGLSDFVGKQCAIFPDAHLGKLDHTQIVERLKTITGNDPVQIERKHKNPFTTKLTTKITIISNAPLNFKDETGAMGSRIIVFPFKQSFEKTKDPHLLSKLIKELPGIANWALKGLLMLRENKAFIHPKGSENIISAYKIDNSPICSFVEDKCKTPIADSISTDALRTAYYDWCTDNGVPAYTAERFGRELTTAYPYIVRVKRTGDSGSQEYHYDQISLN